MLIDEINYFQNQARVNFENYGELVPVMFGLYKDEETGEYTKKIIGIVFNEPEDKEALTHFLCNEIKHSNLKEYLLILESWITEIKNGLKEKSECVMMIYGGTEKEKVYMSKINRNPDTLLNWESCNVKSMDGRFIGLFKKAMAEWN